MDLNNMGINPAAGDGGSPGGNLRGFGGPTSQELNMLKNPRSGRGGDVEIWGKKVGGEAQARL